EPHRTGADGRGGAVAYRDPVCDGQPRGDRRSARAVAGVLLGAVPTRRACRSDGEERGRLGGLVRGAGRGDLAAAVLALPGVVLAVGVTAVVVLLTAGT